MFKAGNILYFDNFIFSNGSSPKPKYFLILKDDLDENNLLLLSLPSSKVHVPLEFSEIHGCLNIKQKGLGCYIFHTDKIVTDCGFKFPKMTYLYAEFVTTSTENHFINTYQSHEYRLIGNYYKKKKLILLSV